MLAPMRALLGLGSRVLGLLSAIAFVSACAPMSVGRPVVTDVAKGSYPRSSANGKLTAEVVQDESTLDVSVTRLCDVTRIDKVERTTTREYNNDAPLNDWWAGIGGAALVGVGVASIVSPSLWDSEKLSEKEVRGSGYVFAGVGALLLAVPVIDYFRAHQVAEHHVDIVEQTGPSLGRNVACGSPEPGTQVSLRLGERVVPLQPLDGRGRARIDLEATLPNLPLRRETLGTVEVRSQPLGAVSLGAVYASRESAAWQSATATNCATSLDENACAEHTAFLRAYPDSENVPEARRVLEEARSRREAAAEQVAFETLDVGSCSAPAKRETLALRTACAPLSAFLARHPGGAHAESVRAALMAGDQLFARLREAEDRAARVPPPVAVPGPGEFIPYKGNGRGPTLCRDNTWSHSSGRGTCSHHGGIAR